MQINATLILDGIPIAIKIVLLAWFLQDSSQTTVGSRCESFVPSPPRSILSIPKRWSASQYQATKHLLSGCEDMV